MQTEARYQASFAALPPPGPSTPALLQRLAESMDLEKYRFFYNDFKKLHFAAFRKARLQPSAEAEQQLLEAIGKARSLYVSFLRANPFVVFGNLNRNLETGFFENPGDLFWERVALDCLPYAKPGTFVVLKGALLVYEERMAAVHSDRERLKQRLSVLSQVDSTHFHADITWQRGDSRRHSNNVPASYSLMHHLLSSVDEVPLRVNLGDKGAQQQQHQQHQQQQHDDDHFLDMDGILEQLQRSFVQEANERTMLNIATVDTFRYDAVSRADLSAHPYICDTLQIVRHFVRIMDGNKATREPKKEADVVVFA